MNDDVEFSFETTRKINDAATRWHFLRAGSSLSFESSNSDDSYSPRDQHLQYFPQKETQSLRRLIPATWPEVLSFYRSYVTALHKIDIASLQYVQFNRFFWYFITNLFFKSLPHTYVQAFLASYAKDEHFFAPKMVPIAYGLIFVYILSAFQQTMMQVGTVTVLLDYFVNGIVNKNPWDRCVDKNQNNSIDFLGLEIHCYELNKFAKTIKYDNITFAGFAYRLVYFTNSSGYEEEEYELFHMPQALYYLKKVQRLFYLNDYFISWYFLIIWLLINVLNYQLFSRWIWKMQHTVQWAINIMYSCIFLHLIHDYLLGQLENIPQIPDLIPFVYDIALNFDLHLLAESMTTPPIIHILMSRSSRESQPSKDGSVIVFFNGIYYLFKGLLAYRMKKYCDSILQVTLHLFSGFHGTFYYLWPMYFSTFYLGGLFCLTFFCLHFLLEFLIAVISYQCLIEAIVCEWPSAKRYIVAFVMMILGIITYFFLYGVMYQSYMIIQGAVTMLEIIVIYIIYPVDRLVDDITFFTGVIPTQLRILNLRIVPIYYGMKLYIMISSIFSHLIYDEILGAIVQWSYRIILAITVAGAVYITFKKMLRQKMNWKSLFVPDVNWGPEYSVRQIRKDYDSREYVGSQAPKLLSRYMIKKAEAKKYTLNIKYDEKDDTRSTSAPAEFRYEDEKKNV